MSFGIFGYGSFGKLLSELLLPYGSVSVYSKRDVSAELLKGVVQTELSQVAKAKIVIISCGLSELKAACNELAPLVSPTTIVADVCSVKAEPVKIMKDALGGKCQLLATHPLFGPHTIKDGKIAGEKIVVYPIKVNNFASIKSLLKDVFGLEVIEMDPQDHDKEMAWVHGLTFFIGRALMQLDLPKSNLTTGYYQKLIDLVELESSHSIELFETVELGNPYAGDIRKEFMNVLKKLDNELKA